MKKKRIIGIDVARALAVIGMIIVNFKVVFGDQGAGWVKSLAGLFDGKAAATFVVLAGVGLALTTKSAIQNNDLEKLKKAKYKITKRALFLFVIGLSYLPIWPADILHFYGVYMALTIFFLASSSRKIIIAAVLFIIAFPLLLLFFDYELGWNFDTLEYLDFWTFEGFFRNLFINGFHPVIPWTAFMLFGYWLGKQNLQNERYVRKVFRWSAMAFISIQLLSYSSILFFSEGSQEIAAELSMVLGTSPMPPFPMYMLNGVAIAFTIISACILLAWRLEGNPIIKALNKTGQLALTFYVAHVVIGMGLIEVLYPNEWGTFSVEFSVLYALIFSFLCILFAATWLRYKKAGPLEWIMRKLTG